MKRATVHRITGRSPAGLASDTAKSSRKLRFRPGSLAGQPHDHAREKARRLRQRAAQAAKS